jgi:glycosyltransferase involved in cell wall biosynthesis
MRISLDAHAIGSRLTGNETYIRNLLNQLAQTAGGENYIAHYSKEHGRRYIPSSICSCRVSRFPLRRLGWGLTRQVRQAKSDVLHVQYTAPLAVPVPVVSTVHDVSFLDHPEFYSPYRRMQLGVTVKRTVERAFCILTPSEFSRRRILLHCKVNSKKVRLIPNGVGPEFKPVYSNDERMAASVRVGVGAPFILSVGDLRPRKNQIGLIRAFEEVVRHCPGIPHHLVFVGQNGWRAMEVHTAARKSVVADRIHFTGYVDDADLLDFYAACELFVFPSFYEGFGLPILEAMACGRAVACSNTTAMPEVAGKAAVYFDPSSQAEMFSAILVLLTNTRIRAHYERMGIERAKRFSWERTAGMVRETYREAVGDRAGKNRFLVREFAEAVASPQRVDGRPRGSSGSGRRAPSWGLLLKSGNC